MKLLTVAMFLVLFVIACSTTKKTQVDSGKIMPSPGAVPEIELIEGKVLYAENCAKCHPLFAPDTKTKDDWIKWLNIMKKNTQLTKEQAGYVLDYLVSESKK